jgi:predicted Zn-dependent protease
VGAKLESGELEEASRLLDWAVARFGPAPALREQWERLEQLKRQAASRRAEELLRDARLLLKVDDHEDAARKLARVLELVPGHPAAWALLEQARKGRGRTGR